MNLKMHPQRKDRFISVPSPTAMFTSWVSSAPIARTNTGRDSVKLSRPDFSSSENIRIIPQTKDIESQFQVVLGKCLFDKAVQIAEESVGNTVSSRKVPQRPGSALPCFQARAGTDLGSSGAISPTNWADRTTLRLQRPTRCTSALVQGSRSFDSYINKGSIDKLAVAKTRGAIEFPSPNIHGCLRQIRSASKETLNDFSLRDDFTDKLREGDREQYWRKKQEQKIAEEEERKRKLKERAKMTAILEEMKKEYEERKAKEALELTLKLEAERIAKEKEEQALKQIEETQNQNLDEITSLVSSSSKNSRRKPSKKGRGSKDKSSKKGTGLAKRRTRKQSRGAASTEDNEGGTEKKTILKSDGKGRSNTEASEDGSSSVGGKGKRVTFPEKLQITKTFKPNKPVSPRKGSPRRSFPGSSSTCTSQGTTEPTPGEKRKKPGKSKSSSGTVKGRKKSTKKQTTIEPIPPPELPKEPEPSVIESNLPEPVVEPEQVLQIPEVPEIVADKPPEFCPAHEFKTRRQMVEEWLFYRSGSASCQVNPPIL